jgi:hypothetical protein
MARRKTTRLAFDALMVEGALIAPDMIADVAALKATAQSEADYRIPPGLKLRDEIGRSWRIAEALWARFSQARAGATAYAATQAFVDDLLRQVFGFASLEPVASRQVGSRVFPVRRVALSGRVPIAVAAAGDGLDRGLDQFNEDNRKRSASLLVQELLNADETSRWGIATDGLRLRLLRDNASLTRPAYVQADLERIFRGGLYADFVALWLLIHESRFGASDALPSDCPLERWREAGREAGAKARDRLGVGVEAALKELGSGFIEHPANAALRYAIERGALTSQAVYEELLRLVYRLIFLFTTEDRGLLYDPKADEAAKALYTDGYSLARLRTQAARRANRDENHDLYEGLKIVFRSLWRGEGALALPALGGLFRDTALPNLGDAKISNKRLLEAVFRLAWITEDHTLTRVNWRDMETEELGSVYEALLELTPRVDLVARCFFFAEGVETKGNARKTSGSYYTPDSLVQLLLDSALSPVIERTVNQNPGRAVEALLELTVIDPACGSGHFLLAAGRRLATRVAQLRSPGAPSAEDWRDALRDVARKCLFGVDRNPMAVELCRTALWIESVAPGKPLTFLDAHILCGDSLVGVWDLQALRNGVPDDAYKPLTGDDKAIATAAKKVNKAQREQPNQRSLFVSGPPDLSIQARWLEGLPEDDLRDVEAKAQAFDAYRSGASWGTTKVACDLYIAAFFRPKLKRGGTLAGANAADDVPTTSDVWAALDGHPPQGGLTSRAIDAVAEVRALHWPLAFPQVLAKGGFDCVVGNPPWEMLQLSEEEYFASRLPSISALAGATRKNAISELQKSDPELWASYQRDLRTLEATNNLFRFGGRFPLTATNKLNTYALFAEVFLNLKTQEGHSGIIVPTGIATDDGNKGFFDTITGTGRLVSMFDFENKNGIFPAVHRTTKFVMLTLGANVKQAEFTFFATEVYDIVDPLRRFPLTADDIRLINPNTRTCPVFRSRVDSQLTSSIYRRVPVLVNEAGEHPRNPWGISFRQGLFNMTSESGFFRTADDLIKDHCERVGVNWVDQTGAVWVPLYEAKMFDLFDHRAASYASRGNERGYRVLPDTSLGEHCDRSFCIEPFYWVPASEVAARLEGRWSRDWLLGFKDVSTPITERSFVATLFPRNGVGNNMPLIIPSATIDPVKITMLLANFSSLVFDYIARQKIGRLHFNYFIVKQLPVLAPEHYTKHDIEFILPRVLELVYTADDMAGYATDVGYTGAPFTWDEGRRAQLRAELDAYYARLYGLTRDEIAYILDPAEIYGADFPSETFRVLKQTEIRAFGEYRTARLLLNAWDEMVQQQAVVGT